MQKAWRRIIGFFRIPVIIIHWAPKETLQSSLLNNFIKCSLIAFLHLVKVVRDISSSGYCKGEKTSTVERKYSKAKKNHQKLITKRKHKASLLAHYTNIGNVIKRFRTAAINDLDQWQFVLKLSWNVSFIILNLCTK